MLKYLTIKNLNRLGLIALLGLGSAALLASGVRADDNKTGGTGAGGDQADCDGGAGYDGSICDEAGVAGGRGTMSNRGEKTHWDADNKRHSEKLDKDNAALKKEIKVGDWNDVVLTVKGNHITYRI